MSDFGTPFRAVLDHCKLHGIRVKSHPREQMVRFSTAGDAAIYNCWMQVTHQEEIFQIWVDYPVLAKDAKMRAEAAEFVARANHRLVIGHFELDMSDGQVRFHVGHVIGELGLREDTICRLVGAALGTANRYFPGFMLLLFGGHTAEDAVYLCELPVHSDEVETPPPATPPAARPAVRAKKPAPRRRRRPKNDENQPNLFSPPPGRPGKAPGQEDAPPQSS